MHAWEAIQKAVDYIEENIKENLTSEKLADVAGLSPFYFQRLFTRLVKTPVGEYVKKRRLARACEVLSDKNKRILDIALEFSFNSHESFTKTFKSAFGITPDEFRQCPVRLNQVIKPELLIGYTMIDEGVPLITENIVLEITRKRLDTPEFYVGLTAQIPINQQIPLGETTGIDYPGQLWDKFHSLKSNIKELDSNATEIGVSMMGKSEDGTFTYFVGKQANQEIALANGLMAWELIASDYIVCTFEAESFTELTSSALGKAMNYLFGTWLTKHKITTEAISIEKYFNLSSDISKMEIWVVPVKGTELEC